jgi:hypothetical protein
VQGARAQATPPPPLATARSSVVRYVRCATHPHPSSLHRSHQVTFHTDYQLDAEADETQACESKARVAALKVERAAVTVATQAVQQRIAALDQAQARRV